jgi:IS30 family transposase
MTQYRDILRMHNRGISQRSIESSLHCSRHTISKVIKRAQELELTWPLKDDLTEDRLAALFSPGFQCRSHMSHQMQRRLTAK